MKLYRVIFSPTDRMEKVANALSCGWNREQETADLLEADRDYRVYKLEAGDVYVMAVPSFGGRTPVVVLKRLSSMKGDQVGAVLAAMYDNRDFEDILLESRGMLEMAGFRCVATMTVIVEHSITHQFAAGRPDEKDIAQPKIFTEQIREKLKGDKAQEPTLMPGNHPYRKCSGAPLRPKTDKTCCQCGVYARERPVHAIPKEDMTRTDEDMCISRTRCIAVCPSGSRGLNRVMANMATQELKRACAEPKQNELLLQLITEVGPGVPP